MPEIKSPRRKRCSICQYYHVLIGNNAEPINHGRCCDLCNVNIVIPARIARLTQNDNLFEVRESKHEPT